MKRLTLLTLLVALIAMECGCSTLSNRKPTVSPFKKLMADDEPEDEELQVTTMAVIWKDTVYSGGANSVRGFGGRVFFYDSNNQPMKADGEFVVYGFDDSKKERETAGADRRYVFERKDIEKHYSESDLGHSYSFWIPWEKSDGVRKTITLIPVFKTPDNRVVKCGQSIQTLPGKEPVGTFTSYDRESVGESFRVLGSSPAIVAPRNDEGQSRGQAKQKASSGVVRASFDESEKSAAASKDTFRSSTFMLPPSMATRLASTNRQMDQSSGEAKADANTIQTQTVEPRKTGATVPKRTPSGRGAAARRSPFEMPGSSRQMVSTAAGVVQSNGGAPQDMYSRWRDQLPRQSVKSKMMEARKATTAYESTDFDAVGAESSASSSEPAATQVYGQPGSFK